MISDVSCFTDCGIKEIHLPEHCLKTGQPKEKAASKAKETSLKAEKAGAQSCKGVPFRAVRQKTGKYPYSLQEQALETYFIIKDANRNFSNMHESRGG